MKKVLFAAAFATLLTLAGCGGGDGPDDVEVGIYYVFANATDVTVTVEAYDGGTLKESWTIEPGEALEQSRFADNSNTRANLDPGAEFGGELKYDIVGRISIMNYNSARVVFGDTREMWFSAGEIFAPYNIYNALNYIPVMDDEAELGMKSLYRISEEMMNDATEIR